MSQNQKDKVMERIKKADDALKDSVVYNDWLNDSQISKK